MFRVLQRVLIFSVLPPALCGGVFGSEEAEAEQRAFASFAETTTRRAGRDWWALQPVVRPQVPGLPDGAGSGNPIDAFVLTSLKDRGFSAVPPAEKRVLLRRLHQDLTGLPPTISDVEAFLGDPSQAAWEKAVDRLLAAPEFGERWGRHWLDVVRYADTCGYERDQEKPAVWKYRDWVIRAFNDDMPYDEFVRKQLAGDELPQKDAASMAATGFLRLGTWNDEPNDPEEYKFERLEDMVGATSTAFLGLTIKCARCHDHKFDPITQMDYHRMAAAFWAGPIDPGPREWLGGPDPRQFAAFGEVFAWTDRSAAPPPLPFLNKGDAKHPGSPVEFGHPGFVTALMDRKVAPPPPGSSTTTRRLQLAQWITDPRNPLTSRVWVNRLWQGHFGHGLVRSPDNFGFTGDKPAHPALLDWLAAELIDGGWKSKRLHKLILMSRTWQQASVGSAEQEAADPGNMALFRQNRLRLQAEALRDAMLAVSGKLDLSRRGGPPFAPALDAAAVEGLSMKGGAWKPAPPEEQGRRSVYMLSKRSLLHPMATVFDFPDTTLPCGRRDVTTVAPQALALLNNPFVHEQSEAFARRVFGGADDEASRIRLAWRTALLRDPQPDETAAAAAHLAAQRKKFGASAEAELRAMASLCQVLFNTNEFAYVD